MAAQVDLVRIKVENKVRDGLEKFAKEKKKRELSPSADKRQRSSEETKKVKLHHHRHHHDPQHVQQQQNGQPQPRNSSAEKPTLQRHQQQQQHQHHNTNGAKKDSHLQPTLPARKVVRAAVKLDRKKALPPVLPPGLFNFTSLKVAEPKDKIQESKEKHREKELKLKPKKENTEANVKHGVVLYKKKKGRLFFILFHYISMLPLLMLESYAKLQLSQTNLCLFTYAK